MTVCIIPARGGSKGIPGKNVVRLHGKPLIQWTIEQARASSVRSVIVSTDCQTIAEVATSSGASVFRRGPLNATDTATTESAVLEVLDSLQLAPGEPIVLLQCTSPIRQPYDIDDAINLLKQMNCDSVFSARRVEGYCWKQTGRTVEREYTRKPRQLEPTHTLEENGSIYVFRQEMFRRTGDRICGHVVPYLMHPLDSFQVDEPNDLELMETLIPLRMPHASCVAA